MSDVWRCEITHNPVGTDTIMIGHPCQCQGCRAAAEIERLHAEVKRWHLAYEEARDMARCALEATSKE